MDDPLVNDDARALIADLTVRRQTVATAESLTAGLLAATLAGVPGASSQDRRSPGSCCWAMPKSMTRGSPISSIMTLPGFRSRWSAP